MANMVHTSSTQASGYLPDLEIPQHQCSAAPFQWNKLAIAMSGKKHFISFEDILYCRAESNYTFIFTSDGQARLSSRTLKSIADKLPADVFIRIHQSFLVNLRSIAAYDKQSAVIELGEGQLLPVSRARRKYVRSFLKG